MNDFRRQKSQFNSGIRSKQEQPIIRELDSIARLMLNPNSELKLINPKHQNNGYCYFYALSNCCQSDEAKMRFCAGNVDEPIACFLKNAQDFNINRDKVGWNSSDMVNYLYQLKKLGWITDFKLKNMNKAKNSNETSSPVKMNVLERLKVKTNKCFILHGWTGASDIRASGNKIIKTVKTKKLQYRKYVQLGDKPVSKNRSEPHGVAVIVDEIGMIWLLDPAKKKVKPLDVITLNDSLVKVTKMLYFELSW